MYIEIEYFQLDLKFFPVVPRNLRSKKRLILQSDEIYQKYIHIHVLYIRTEKFFQVIIYLYLLSKSLFTICIILTVFFNA